MWCASWKKPASKPSTSEGDIFRNIMRAAFLFLVLFYPLMRTVLFTIQDVPVIDWNFIFHLELIVKKRVRFRTLVHDFYLVLFRHPSWDKVLSRLLEPFFYKWNVKKVLKLSKSNFRQWSVNRAEAQFVGSSRIE